MKGGCQPKLRRGPAIMARTHLLPNVSSAWGENLREITMKETGYYTVRELARHLRVNTKTVYRRLWDRRIPAIKTGRTWRIAKSDLIWLKK